MFELPTGMHLLKDLETIDEVRPAWSTDYFVTGARSAEIVTNWANEINDLVRVYGGSNRRLAVDRFDVDTAAALHRHRHQLSLSDGKIVMEHARAIKSLEEIRALQQSLLTELRAAMYEVKEQVQPGMTEQDALSILLAGSIRRGGEYSETRLLTTGPRTNPWFQGNKPSRYRKW